MAEPDNNEDRLFLVDASGSMGGKLGKWRKIELVKSGLLKFCMDRWPISYYAIPLRIGMVAFRLLGTPGHTVYETIIPLYPTAVSLELYRINDLDAKGGSWVADGLNYARHVIVESERRQKRVCLISDGSFEGPDPLPVADQIRGCGALLSCVELAKESSRPMQDIAQHGGGSYSLAATPEEFGSALG